MPGRSSALAHAVTSTMDSPALMSTEPFACLAMRPVSMVMVVEPTSTLSRMIDISEASVSSARVWVACERTAGSIGSFGVLDSWARKAGVGPMRAHEAKTGATGSIEASR